MLSFTSIKYLVNLDSDKKEAVEPPTFGSIRQSKKQSPTRITLFQTLLAFFQPLLKKQGLTKFDASWPIAILAGSAISLPLFAVLIGLGEKELLLTPPSPTRLTIGFAPEKVPAAPVILQGKPDTARQQSETPKKNPVKTAPQPKPVIKQPVIKKQAPRAETGKTVTLKQPQAAPVDTGQKQKIRQRQQRAQNQRKRLAEPVPVYRLTELPRFIHKEKPVYPASLRHQGREATVKLEVYIDAKGKPRNIKLLQSAGTDFDQAAINAIRASTFAPGNVNGKPVSVQMRMPIKFKLR